MKQDIKIKVIADLSTWWIFSLIFWLRLGMLGTGGLIVYFW